MTKHHRRAVLAGAGALTAGAVLPGGATADDSIEGPTIFVPVSNTPDWIAAIDPVSGEERWRTTGDGLEGPPVVVDGTLYCRTDYGGDAILALEAATGEQTWLSRGDRPAEDLFLYDGPTVVGGTVYVGYRESDGPGGILALDAATGAELWATEGHNHWLTPTVVDDLVFAAKEDRLAAIDADNGSEVWLSDPADTEQLGPTTHWSGMLFATGSGGSVQAWDAETGDLVWERTATLRTKRPDVTVVDDAVFGFDSEEEDLVALEAATGEERWRVDQENSHYRDRHAPTVAEGTVYAAAKYARAVDAQTGEIEWISTELDVSPGTPTAWSDLVLVGGVAERFGFNLPGFELVALERDTGEVRWRYNANMFHEDPDAIDHFNSIEGPTVVDETHASSTDTRILQGSVNHHHERLMTSDWHETDEVVSISLETPDVIEPGEDASVSVLATHEDDTTSDVTDEATIEATVPGVASVSTDGAINARSAGETAVTASYEEFTAEATFTVEANWVLFDQELANDGSSYAIGFPGPPAGTLEEQFPSGFDGISSAFVFEDGSWQRLTDPFGYEPGPLEVVVVLTSGSGPDTIPVDVMVETETAVSSKTLDEGWHCIAPPVAGDPADCFDPERTAVVLDRFDHPVAGPESEDSGTAVTGDSFSYEVVRETELGDPVTLSPFTGYFVYSSAEQPVEIAAEDVSDYHDAATALDLME